MGLLDNAFNLLLNWYLAQNESAHKVLGDDQLRVIARELLNKLEKNVSIDWAQREPSRARIRMLVKRILRNYGYPFGIQDAAMQSVLQQAEVFSGRWAA